MGLYAYYLSINANPYYKISFAVLLKYWIHSLMSGTEFSQLYSYSIENTPLKFWDLSSFNIPFTSRMPVPQITSCCSFSPAFFGAISLKCKEMIRPLSCFKQSIWFSPSRNKNQAIDCVRRWLSTGSQVSSSRKAAGDYGRRS